MPKTVNTDFTQRGILGNAEILNMNCFDIRENIQSKLGYLPGEITFIGRDERH
ncbi:hypothetical protein OGZ02_07070 [Brachyspira hyodysenteriae]|nr:hypothetical protein [Brachyspira hyodysenteriae]MDA1468605.1 hypothetical protein [Brachyspira hyodysenteriae]